MKKFVISIIISGLVFSLSSMELFGQETKVEESPSSSTEITVGGVEQPIKEQKQVVLPPQFKMGYVDVTKIFDEYSRTKKAKAEMDKDIKLKEQQIRNMEKELRKLREAFEREKDTLGDESRKEKENLIEEKSDQIQKFTEQAEEELSTKEAKLTEEIVGEIYDVIYSVGTEEGFSIILDKSNVIYGDKNLDLTQKVINKLENKR